MTSSHSDGRGGAGGGHAARGRAALPWTRRDALGLAALALAPFLYSLPLFLPAPYRRWLEDGDFVDQFFAFARFETAQLMAGELPLWNPYAYAGSPFWADVQAAVAYPPSLATVLTSGLLFGRLPYLALEAEAVAHLALAAALTYLFARRHLRSRAGAALAALAFALGGFLTGYPVLQLAVLETCVWLPLALWGVDEAVEGGRGWPLLALALGMAVLAGHPQSALYLLYATAAYALWRAWPWQAALPATRRAAWARLAAAAGLGALLSAAGWWPAAEYLAVSTRAQAHYAMLAHGFPPRELLGIALAGVTKWSPLYVGVLPLLLAIAAAGRALLGEGAAARVRDDRFWLALAGLGLLLSLGGHAALFDAFYLAAPGFGFFRGQERAAFLVAFALAMLAGSGMAALASPRGRAPLSRVLLLGGAGLAAVALALAFLAGPETRPALLRLTFAAAACAGLGAAAPRIPSGRPLLLPVLALALAFLDLASAGADANLQAQPPAELARTPLQSILTMSGLGRVDDEHRYPENYGVLHGVEWTRGASPLRLRSFDRLREALADRPERLRALLAVSHVTTWRQELPGATELLSEGEGEARRALYVLDAPRPYAWRVAAAEVLDDDAAAARLRDADFEPFSRVLLANGKAGEPRFAPGQTTVEMRAPGEIRVRSEGAEPGWLVLSEMHAPGWRATVDGEAAEILRANLALMAVALPAGEHEVRLWYDGTREWTGIGLSLLGLAGVVGLLLGGWWRGREPAGRAVT